MQTKSEVGAQRLGRAWGQQLEMLSCCGRCPTGPAGRETRGHFRLAATSLLQCLHQHNACVSRNKSQQVKHSTAAAAASAAAAAAAANAEPSRDVPLAGATAAAPHPAAAAGLVHASMLLASRPSGTSCSRPPCRLINLYGSAVPGPLQRWSEVVLISLAVQVPRALHAGQNFAGGEAGSGKLECGMLSVLVCRPSW